jgi:putative N6-adenine-specific DNA methylase
MGLEEVLAQEILDLGGRDVEIFRRAVSFTGNKELLYKANYRLRTAIRVLTPIYTFKAKTQEEFDYKMLGHNWDHYLDVDGSLAIDAYCDSEVFNHSKYLAQRSKDMICDMFREKFEDKRPYVNLLTPDVRFNVHLKGTEFTVSLDSSNESLHKRGYRVRTGEAPLNEVLAAGLVMLSGWKGEKPLLDPMCGSGSIVIEAALLALGRSPHEEERAFGFMSWKNFDSELWNKVRNEKYPGFDSFEILASDSHMKMTRATEDNAMSAGVADYIQVKRKDFFKRENTEPVCIITNPPYDERLELLNPNKFYREIGNRLKRKYVDSEAWILSGNIDAIKRLGLKTSRRIHMMNGPIEAKYHKFEVYEGSK